MNNFAVLTNVDAFRSNDLHTPESLRHKLSEAKRRLGLVGLSSDSADDSFIGQLTDSLRAVRYYDILAERNISTARTDPLSEYFDPVKSAILHFRSGNFDEACWLAFLMTNFGRHRHVGWRLLQEVYRGDSKVGPWRWHTVTRQISDFRTWVKANESRIRSALGTGGFGNHRKYISLGADKRNGAVDAVESYVQWINPPSTHAEKFDGFFSAAKGNAAEAFELAYQSMRVVASFGRIGRFDYLTMIGRLGFAQFSPGRAYLSDGATGPKYGAKLLFWNDPKAKRTTSDLESRVNALCEILGVGNDVLEDAICNWQKNPARYIRYRG